MARKSAILSVRILADAQNAVAGMNKASGAMGLLGKAAGAAAGLFAVDKIVDFGKRSIMAAGELEQSAGAVDAVFGKGAGKMETWAAGAATSVGLTKNEFNELGTLIGAQLKNGGTAMDQLAPKTNQLIGLGADLASMFGGSSKEAVEALSSALKGERDPIEKYGVSLNQAKIDAEAAALGFEKVGGSLSAEANQAATLSLIMKQTADAHGNFAKESSTMMGGMERARATWGNITATIGGLFLPAVTAAFGVLNTHVLPAISSMVDGLGSGGLGGALGPLSPAFSAIGAVAGAVFAQLGPAVATVVSAFAPLAPMVLDLLTQFSPLSIVFQVIGGLIPQLVPVVAQLAATLGTVLAAVIPLATELAGAIIPLFAQFASAVLPLVVDAVTQVVGALAPLVTTLLGILVPAVQALLPIITGVVQSILANVTGVITGLVQVITGVVDFVGAIFRGDWAAAWSAVQQIVSGAVTAVWNLVQLWIVGKLVAGVRGALTAARGVFTSAWSAIRSVVTSGVQAVRQIVATVLAGVQNLIRGNLSTAQALFSRAWSAIRSLVTGAIRGVQSVISSTLSRISSSWSSAWRGAQQLLSGVWRGITSAVSSGVGRVLGLFRSLPGKIRGALAGAGQWLYGAGKNIVQGLINGAGSLLGSIGRFFLNKLPGWIRGPFQSALGIASPSRVFAGYGKNIVQGITMGVAGEERQAVRALDSLAGSLASTGQRSLDRAVGSLSYPGAQLNLSGAGAGGAVHHHEVNITVQTGVGDPVAIGRELDRVLTRYRRTLGTVAHAA